MADQETPSSHETAASDSLAQIRTIMQGVPGYGFAGAKHRSRIGAVAAVPDRFLLAVALALDASPTLAAAAGVTGAELREAVSYAHAYRPFASELTLMGNGMLQGVQAKRADKASLAFKAYRLAKGYNSPADRQLLVPHIASMRAALGRGRPSVKATAPPEPEPGTGTPKEGSGNA